MSTTFRVAIALCLGLVFVLTVSVIAFAGDTTGSSAYQQYCAGCHGSDGQGTPYGPNIQGESYDEIIEVVREGDDEMPAYDSAVLDQYTLNAMASYLAGNGTPADDEYGDHEDDDGHGDHDDDDDDDDDHDRGDKDKKKKKKHNGNNRKRH